MALPVLRRIQIVINRSEGSQVEIQTFYTKNAMSTLSACLNDV